VSIRLMDFTFFISRKHPRYCPRCCSQANEPILRRKMHGERVPIRTGASVARAGFEDHDNAPARTSAGIWLDDDFSFHIRMDRAQVVIVTRSCKSERELGVLDKSF
jgi:hypothetical protein